MTRREMTYAILVALGVLLPMYYNVQYLGAGGNLLMDFFTAPMQSAVTASLLFDLLIAFAAGLPLFLLLRERQKRLG